MRQSVYQSSGGQQVPWESSSILGDFYFTGGPTNPFVSFFLLPLVITAALLPPAYTWLMAALTIVCWGPMFPIAKRAYARVGGDPGRDSGVASGIDSGGDPAPAQ